MVGAELVLVAHPVEERLPGVAADPATVQSEVDAVFDQVFAASGLERPDVPAIAAVAGRTGRDGVHTEALGYLLAELQHLARSLPGAVW